MTTPGDESPLTLKDFADSFFYGSRSNLDFKFLADLSDTEAANFFEELLAELGRTLNDGDATRLVDHARSWQRRAYGAHLDSKAAFTYDDVPFSILTTPLTETPGSSCTSTSTKESGHGSSSLEREGDRRERRDSRHRGQPLLPRRRGAT